MITCKSRLDYEMESSYTLTVMASDNGTPRKVSYVLVNATVLDSNDNRPKFHRRIYRFNVTENVPSSIVGLLTVSVASEPFLTSWHCNIVTRLNELE